MSWSTLKVAELRRVADEFGVEVDEKAKKPEIIAALAEEGVTFEQYEQFQNAEKVDPQEEELIPAPKQAASEDDVLVKMDRANFRYDIHGFTFTKQHPYCVVPREVAQNIFDTAEGFRLATPREVDEYYS